MRLSVPASSSSTRADVLSNDANSLKPDVNCEGAGPADRIPAGADKGGDAHPATQPAAQRRIMQIVEGNRYLSRRNIPIWRAPANLKGDSIRGKTYARQEKNGFRDCGNVRRFLAGVA